MFNTSRHLFGTGEKLMAMRRYPSDVFEEMERMMELMRDSMIGGVRDAREWTGTFESNIDIERMDDEFVVLADMPGFEKEEIDLQFHDGHLSVEATHEVESESEGVRSARSRSIRESVRVPGDVVVEEISATYRNGVLEVHLPIEVDKQDETARIDVE